ncbi:hypothetical protein TNCV_2260431 [Trichonephila clavipes]|nr:hypothetical protein TNCV_2260431 [Trichonephila clavipes]
MKVRAYCVHPNTRDHWALRFLSRYLDQVVRLKREPQCLSSQASLVIIYRSTAIRMQGIGKPGVLQLPPANSHSLTSGESTTAVGILSSPTTKGLRPNLSLRCFLSNPHFETSAFCVWC